MDIFDNNTGLYFYSAVFQGNMALLGLLAIFAVYRLQALDSKISQLFDNAINHARDLFLSRNDAPIPLSRFSVVDFKRSLHEWANKPELTEDTLDHGRLIRKEDHNSVIGSAQMLLEDPSLKGMLDAVPEQQKLRKNIMRRMWCPFVALSVIVIASLICLMCATCLHRSCCIELIVFLFFVVGELLTLILIFAYAQFALSGQNSTEES